MQLSIGMPIKNKDGSDFSLAKPNPLMASQNLWNNRYILHNWEWQTEPLFGVLTKKVTIPAPKPDPVQEILVEKPVAVEGPVVVQALEEAEPTEDGRIRVWCLPAQVKEQVDKLYGQKYSRIKYGKKFMFEAIPLEEDDLYMVLWTNTRAVTLGSVLFPRNDNKRWWRVNAVDAEEGGYRLLAGVCDFTPEFSS